MGQVEPRLGTAITRANLWLVQAPGHTEQCVWDVIVLAARNNPYGNWKALYGGVAEGGRPGRAHPAAWRQERSWRREAQDGM